MNTIFLVCFVLGLMMSVLAVFTGLGRVHLGHLHFGNAHVHFRAKTPAHASSSGGISPINGFTLPAFLCWFGGAGYLLYHFSGFYLLLTILMATASGLLGAALIYVVLFKFLIPHERVLLPEDTRMDGVLAHVSDAIRADGGIGEILFSQTGARKSAAARSESGAAISRGTEVVVLHYVRGIAYVSPLDQLTFLQSESCKETPQKLP